MRAMVLQEGYGIEYLKPQDRPVVEPGPGQVALAMKAASLNYRDLATVTGAFGRARLPLVPLSDGCGVVTAVGAGVTRVAVGDRVAPLFFQGWFAGEPTPQALGTALGSPIDGCAQEVMVLSEQGVSKAPANLTDAEVACLPCAALTAWRGLFAEGNVKPGDWVLCQGTGGVSILALQFAKAAGARVIITSSSDEKLERAKELGADFGINYRTTPDWATAARKITGGRGVDYVVEVGGADTFTQSLAAIRLGGNIVVIGLLSGMMKDMNVAAIFGANAHITGITVGSRTNFEDMVRAIEANDIHPLVDKRFALEDAGSAFTAMKAGEHFGKIVLDIG
ncbi:zinc-dependent alcohol dehydrogenase family protein [Zavarzinia sp. CC-PAN008]|uniref:zinc-dependent alcohol dehydrogenase family protein n=1 Tax=Zavarzinia sp. CC-PAN008 TaxID=3243332 RepID=UPI003F746DD0